MRQCNGKVGRRRRRFNRVCVALACGLVFFCFLFGLLTAPLTIYPLFLPERPLPEFVFAP